MAGDTAGDRPDDGLDDHPDLSDLRWSAREERRALRRGRGPRTGFLRRHRAKWLAVGGIVALIVAGAVAVDLVRGPAQPDPASQDRPRKYTAVDLTRPFAGTPAVSWADGPAGIVAPAPVAIGDYTAPEVAKAYAAVRHLLITARLDRAVIERREVDRYLRLLAPAAQRSVRPSFAEEHEDPADAYFYATRIADGFRLLPAPPKVRGKMWAELDGDGALLVHTAYVFAYAFHTDEPERLLDPMDIVAVNRFAADFLVVDERWPPGDRGLWPREVEAYGYSAACTAYRNGALAPTYSERLPDDGAAYDAEADEARKRAFDPNLPMPTSSNCPEAPN